MQRKATAWFSGILIVLGILGFVPGITTSSHHLVGLFQVGAWYNTLYIVAGVIGLLSLARESATVGYLRTIAVVMAVWAIIGLFVGSTGQVLGFISNNYWDVLLNAVLAIVAAAYGWSNATVMADQPGAVAFGEYQGDRERRRRW